MGKYESRSDSSAIQKHSDAVYFRGEIVYIITDLHSIQNQPKDCQKLWIWEHKWDPTWKNVRRGHGNTVYLLKDGPGEKAKDVCWMSEDNIQEWTRPKVEESLIDLDAAPPAYEEVVKKEQ